MKVSKNFKFKLKVWIKRIKEANGSAEIIYNNKSEKAKMNKYILKTITYKPQIL